MADDAIDIDSSLVRSDESVGAITAPPYPAAEYQHVLLLTERLFPGPIDVGQEIDPEIPGHRYLVFGVVAKGSFDDIMARDRQWHREIAREFPQFTNIYTLSIDVQE